MNSPFSSRLVTKFSSSSFFSSDGILTVRTTRDVSTSGQCYKLYKFYKHSDVRGRRLPKAGSHGFLTSSSEMWCLQARKRRARLTRRISLTIAPLSLPVFEAVVSHTMATNFSRQFHILSLSKTASPWASPVEVSRPSSLVNSTTP